MACRRRYVVFEGTVVLGNGVRIGANCVVRDTEIGDGVEVPAGEGDAAAVGFLVRPGAPRPQSATHLVQSGVPGTSRPAWRSRPEANGGS